MEQNKPSGRRVLLLIWLLKRREKFEIENNTLILVLNNTFTIYISIIIINIIINIIIPN